MMKRLLGLIVTGIFLGSMTLASLGSEQLVGAIRWDNWTTTSAHSKIIMQTDRAPFFQSVNLSGLATLLGGETNTVDAENAYGRSAGLDYWIFGYYLDDGSYGIPKAESQKLNKSLSTFLSLQDRRGMKFAVNINQTAPLGSKNYLQNTISEFLKDRDYVRFDDGSAPVFVFAMNRWQDSLGTAEKTNVFFRSLISHIKESTGIEVKLITVGGTYESSKPYLLPNGPFSASTTYAHSPQCCAHETPYASCAASVRDYWKGALNSGVPFMPNVTLGWDWRPIVKFPDQMYDRKITNPSWCDPGSSREQSALIIDAAKIGRDSAKTAGIAGFIVYAWNELSEGGWLVPTKTEGTRRLEMFASALGRRRTVDPITIRFPSSPDGYEWPCPPGMKGDKSQVVSPTTDERVLNDREWLSRSCR